MPPVAETPTAARAARKAVLVETRRAHVLEAARAAFAELGLERASLREIARRAGYSPGAIYSYFDSKEAVYAALMGESLERLNACVAEAATDDDPVRSLRRSARAFFDYYRRHPRDLDLGFYLAQGLPPGGAAPPADPALSQRLCDALAPMQQALQRLGMSTQEALVETTALFAQVVGLLLLSRTGRMRLFGQTAPALFERYLDALQMRT
jgi:AcrR family transcriptional regulator